MNNAIQNTNNDQPILVLTANGKTGKRVAQRLENQGRKVRYGSRSAAIPFDWNLPETWGPVLEGVHCVYMVYIPDLAIPQALSAIQDLTHLAVQSGVQKLVLLSGRGEVEAQRCEQFVLNANVASTIVRASWFNQNFSEGEFLDMVLSGTIALPAGDIHEPFIDIDDIADVVVAALTEAGHDGKVYELTGPRLLTFAQAVESIAKASGRDLQYVPITSEQFTDALEDQHVPADFIWLLNYLFTQVLDGRNAHVTDGVQEALGRPARDFDLYAQNMAATGVWDVDSLVGN
ncbi:MAG TPA: NmrA family transcriptional regulator [Phycisphaerales bacterium]|nr:NmrA family transcriptional regulator [Phycisphaerales bacterium]HCD34994.1 NmrA family transcriptional regulator [Phycisphaerales bacterium]|tara:strand:- start:440 stop:1306 length:867 start_codon:yes stop_codon:yes gene_type:complete